MSGWSFRLICIILSSSAWNHSDAFAFYCQTPASFPIVAMSRWLVATLRPVTESSKIVNPAQVSDANASANHDEDVASTDRCLDECVNSKAEVGSDEEGEDEFDFDGDSEDDMGVYRQFPLGDFLVTTIRYLASVVKIVSKGSYE